MLQIHPDEVCSFHRHHFFGVIIGIIFVTKSHCLFVYGDDAAVCNGCTVGISCKVPDGIAFPVKRFLYEWKPTLFKQGVNKVLPLSGILKL